MYIVILPIMFTQTRWSRIPPLPKITSKNVHWRCLGPRRNSPLALGERRIGTRFGPNRVAAVMEATEYLIFWWCMRIFEEIRSPLEDSELPSKRPTKKTRFWGHCGCQIASEVRSDLRFEIYAPKYICYHVCLGCFALFWTKWQKEEGRQLTSTRVAGFAATKNCFPPDFIFAFTRD